MAIGTFLVIILVLVGAALLLPFLIRQASPNTRELKTLRRRLVAAENTIDSVRETAIQHRELDSALSTIICDEVAGYYRKQRQNELES